MDLMETCNVMWIFYNLLGARPPLCSRPVFHKGSVMFISGDWGGYGKHVRVFKKLQIQDTTFDHFIHLHRAITILEYGIIVRKQCYTISCIWSSYRHYWAIIKPNDYHKMATFTIKDPPPCLTVGNCHCGLKASFGFV